MAVGRIKAVSTRTRFEVFKRDNFACRYCGQKSPDVVLELDHIIPRSKGGTNDILNLTTSCFECNRGKSNRNLSEQITGEDPHDKAIELLERERQLKEYSEVKRQIGLRVARDFESHFARRWTLTQSADKYIRRALCKFAAEDVLFAFETAVERTEGIEPKCAQYFHGILRNWEAYGSKGKYDAAFNS